MAHLEFGIWDTFPAHEFNNYALAADAYDQHLYEVQLGEELGYESYYIIEHQNSHIGQLTAPSVYLTAVALRTTSMRFGVMIYQLPFYNPMRLAQDAAMLDHLSHGRLEFGTGIGVAEHEFMRWNLPFFERQKMSSEAMEIILKAWTQDEVTYQGDYWQFDEALPVPKPYQKPYPPIWVGSPQPGVAGVRGQEQLPRLSKPGHRSHHRREIRPVPERFGGSATIPAPCPAPS